MNRRPADDGAAAVETGRAGSDTIVPHTPDEDTTPRCHVVGAHCEALGWLAREPYRRATVCCRSYWAEAEAS